MKSNTKTTGKKKSREPRTQMHLTTQNMFSNVIALWSVLVNLGWSLSYISRLWIAIVKPWNAREISEFYLLQVFLKVDILMIFEFFFKKLRKYQDSEGNHKRKEEKKKRREDACSTSCPSGNQVDGLPLVAMKSNTKTVGKRKSRGRRTPVLLTMKKCF